MEAALCFLVAGAVCGVCFLLGAKVGMSVRKGEPIELPNLNPVKAVQDMAQKREAKKEQEKMEAILRNIDNYDGTGFGQEDVPGR